MLTANFGAGSLVDLSSSSCFIAQAKTAASMGTAQIIGIWVAAFLTLCIFSFLLEDNPIYKFAEHLFVGVSAGYIIATTYQNVIKPNLIGNIKDGVMLVVRKNIWDWEKLSFVIAGILGIMLLMKLIPKVNWISRWPLSFMVGVASGLGVVLTMEAYVLKQIDATVFNLIVRTASNAVDWSLTVQHWLILIGVSTGLIYFYFSKEHKGLVFGTASRVGIMVLMMAFGAAFGYTVMARVSLLIGRMLFFRDEWWPAVQATLRATGIGH